MFTPTPDEQEVLILTDGGYEVELASKVDGPYAFDLTTQMLDLLQRLERDPAGRFRITRDVAAVQDCLASDVVFAIPHVEGAEAITPDLSNLQHFYNLGVRSLGPVWSRPNAFGHGVPYAYPKSPDTGPGLTEEGKELIGTSNRLGIMLDLSHLNLAGFQDIARISDAPLVATHSCVHSICPVTRNVTDWQIDAIGESSGVIGIAYDVSMLRPDGDLDADTPLSVLVDHIDYVAGRIGIEHVALGSDFDGAVIPSGIRDAAGLPNLIAELKQRGYDDASLNLVTHQNWLRVLRETWKRPAGSA